jgi:hypothetical protein
MPPRLGAAFSVPTSTLLFWCLAPFLIDPAEVDLTAAGLFACVGLFFPAAVALSNFESNRLMGPNIAGAVGGLASAIRGFVQPVVKLGLEHWPNPIAAVVIGYKVSSIVVILAAFMPRQTLEQRFDRRGPLWFAAVGLCKRLCRSVDVCCAWPRTCHPSFALGRNISAGHSAAQFCILKTRTCRCIADSRCNRNGQRRRSPPHLLVRTSQ